MQSPFDDSKTLLFIFYSSDRKVHVQYLVERSKPSIESSSCETTGAHA